MAQYQAFVQRRKGRVMAQLLELFEQELEPVLPKEKAEAFKAAVRRKLNGFSTDVTEFIEGLLTGQASNGVAQDIVDRIHVDGRPPARGDTKR